MFIERNPWVVVVGSVMTAVTVYFAAVWANQLDRSDLIGSWFMYACIFVSVATVALVVYRALRRSRGPAAMDEARSKGSY